jgi:hypothetical protein
MLALNENLGQVQHRFCISPRIVEIRTVCPAFVKKNATKLKGFDALLFQSFSW